MSFALSAAFKTLSIISASLAQCQWEGVRPFSVELSPMAGLIRVAETGMSNNPRREQSGIWVELLGAYGNKEMEECQ